MAAQTGELQVLKPNTKEIVPWQLSPQGRYWRLWIPRAALQIDVFLPLRPGWGLTYALRTGSGVGPDGRPYTGFGPALLRRWKQLSPGGYSEKSQLRTSHGEIIATPEERDVFEVLRLRWVPPSQRRSAADVQAAFR